MNHPSALGVVHIAGEGCQAGSLVRQRCAWCGSMLLTFDLQLVEVQAGMPGPAMWPPGALVEVHDGYAAVVAPTAFDGNAYGLPQGSCALLDPAITG